MTTACFFCSCYECSADAAVEPPRRCCSLQPLSLDLREDRFGERARVVLPIPIPPHLDVNEEVVDVLPEAPAVEMSLDVPDPVLRLLVVVGLLDVEDYVIRCWSRSCPGPSRSPGK